MHLLVIKPVYSLIFTFGETLYCFGISTKWFVDVEDGVIVTQWRKRHLQHDLSQHHRLPILSRHTLVHAGRCRGLNMYRSSCVKNHSHHSNLHTRIRYTSVIQVRAHLLFSTIQHLRVYA